MKLVDQLADAGLLKPCKDCHGEHTVMSFEDWPGMVDEQDQPLRTGECIHCGSTVAIRNMMQIPRRRGKHV